MCENTLELLKIVAERDLEIRELKRSSSSGVKDQEMSIEEAPSGFANIQKKDAKKSDEYESFFDVQVQDPPSAFEDCNLSKNKNSYSKPKKFENNSSGDPWFSKNKENIVNLK